MMTLTRAISGGVVAALVFVGASIVSAQASVATTDAPGATLTYSRADDATTCPDEAALRDAVHRQLGYPVFERTPATRALDVSVLRSRGRFVARLSLRSETGAALGAREIESRGSTCDELADALGLAIALALDPSPMLPTTTETDAAATSTVPVVPECPAATPCPEPAACPVCPVPAVTETAWKAGVGVALGVGALPTTAFALSVDLELRIVDTAFLLEGVVYPEVATVQASTALEVQSQVARLGVCQWLLSGADVEVAACVVGGFGALRGSSSMAVDRSLSFVATAGVRAVAELRLVGPVWLQARTDLHANLAGTTLSLGDTRLWETPALFLELAILGVVRFL